MKPKFPNLMIIGAMKCGTTSLHNYLAKHPDIRMSEPKEIHYFSDAVYNKKSLDWYKNHFKTDKQVIGTSPQGYTKCHHLDSANVLERLSKTIPDVKMIYIVRNPIERYKSHILEAYHCDPWKDIKYSRSVDHFIKTSMYYFQISEVLKYFDLKQIHFLSLEDLQENRLSELNKIFDFLNIKKLTDDTVFNFKSNTAEDKSIPHIVKFSIPYRVLNKISSKLAKNTGRTFSKIFLKYQIKKPVLSEKKISELKEILKPDIDKFKKLTKKGFSQWNL
ncbi:MAG: sulfotransferase domain-containing protein [Bacteroidales bacterium]|nr:sulfotransferase domain-containing protein [Bacteroidales bacterium]